MWPATTPARVLRCRDFVLPIGQRTLVMGILNVTPDSFSGDGLGGNVDAAVARARAMVAAGADLIDVGGESTRPRAAVVPAEEEIARVVPVVRALAPDLGVPLSIDTTKPEVAEAALAAGAHAINDVSGLRDGDALARLGAAFGAPLVVMHMKGRPGTMQDDPRYDDLIGEIRSFLAGAVEVAVRAGLPRSQVIVDPGFGFGKTLEHNLEILRNLRAFAGLGQPLMLGTSRKSSIGRLLGNLPVDERLEGTLATLVLGVVGGVDVVRVHDVRPASRAVRVADAVVRGWPIQS